MLNTFLPILMFIVFLIDKGLQEKWHDKKTKKHRYTLGFLIFVQFSLCIATVYVVYKEDKGTSKLRQGIADLLDGNSKLQNIDQELLNKVNEYQMKNKELEFQVSQVGRTTSGQTIIGGPEGGIFVTGEPIFYNKKTKQCHEDIVKGNFEKAQEDLNEALALDVEGRYITGTKLMQAEIYMLEEKFKDGLKELNGIDQTKIVNKNRPYYYRDLTICYNKLGDSKKSQEYKNILNELQSVKP